MRFWDDSLRICPKCKASVTLAGESRVECPQCKAPVWFYSYREIPAPPPLPTAKPFDLFTNPATLFLLSLACLSGLIALIGIYNLSLVVTMSGLSVICVVVFAVMRHLDASRAESVLESAREHQEFAGLMRERVKDLISRYNALLRTGDSRVEHYFGEVYTQAERERLRAEAILAQSRADRDAIRSVEQRIYDMAARLVDDHLKWASQKLRPDPENYQRRKVELEKAFDFVERVGYALPTEIRKGALSKLKFDYAAVVREQTLKDEQRRIQQQMRDEEKLRKEAEKAIREAEKREQDIEQRLEDALRSHKGVMDAEIQALREQLADAQARAERAKSMAQQTKAGHVYILSNIGSFGPNVFKVGMTRRLDPEDRVRELGDASVPFPFDVHAMVSCADAPGLEHALHRELTRYRVNRVNFRKEFFQVDLQWIIDLVRQKHGTVDYVAEPEALQYRETQQITPDELVELEEDLESLGVDFEEADE